MRASLTTICTKCVDRSRNYYVVAVRFVAAAVDADAIRVAMAWTLTYFRRLTLLM